MADHPYCTHCYHEIEPGPVIADRYGPSSDGVQRIIAILNGEPYSIPVYEA